MTGPATGYVAGPVNLMIFHPAVVRSAYLNSVSSGDLLYAM